MSTEISSLWPKDLINKDVRSPFTILKRQAAEVTRVSGGLLRGDIVKFAPPAASYVKYTLEVLAPAAGDLRRQIVIIRHAADGAYPVKFELPDFDAQANDESEFMHALSAALATSRTKSTIDSLIARTNEIAAQEAEK